MQMAPLAKSCRGRCSQSTWRRHRISSLQLRQVAFAPAAHSLSPEGRGDAVERMGGSHWGRGDIGRGWSGLGSASPSESAVVGAPSGIACRMRPHQKPKGAYCPVGLAACSRGEHAHLGGDAPGRGEEAAGLAVGAENAVARMISGMGSAPMARPTARDIATSPNVRAIAP